MGQERLAREEANDLVSCKICQRCFAENRLERHSRICEKQQQSKRKTFDSAQFRAKGTDLEVFMKTNSRCKTPEVKNNWRQKHEALIHNLRQARAPAPGRLQPQPVDVNPDYVSCPHCGRRFAPGPAERHIPKCQNIKSRPPPPRHQVFLFIQRMQCSLSSVSSYRQNTYTQYTHCPKNLMLHKLNVEK
uniref:C2HC/C3H-type domain-containing protein n=1 Tax=Pygocentrus nattereri TaxID=42514 RepID=A0A3B4BU66_PYGNA